jgi:hypothetical protein
MDNILRLCDSQDYTPSSDSDYKIKLYTWECLKLMDYSITDPIENSLRIFKVLLRTMCKKMI